MDIRIRRESAAELDPALTAALAREAFQKHGPELSAERFAWTYRQGYDRSAIVSAFADGAKIGQLACFFKTFTADGRKRVAAEFADLFVSPESRGFKVASSLYKEMQKAVASEGADIMFAYANEGASILNRRFFGMEEVTQLPARLGVCLPGAGLRSKTNITVHQSIDDIASACADCAGSDRRGGVVLNGDELRKRISSPVHRYLCATDGNSAILASARIIRSVPLLFICGTFSRQGTGQDQRATGAMIQGLCRTAGRQLFLYVGWNDAVGLSSGFAVPERLLKGKFLIQSNCLNSRRDSVGRFELLDVDYG